MTISGFTFARNSWKYYFPIKESILSALPVVDEFIVVLGDCDADDETRREIESIDSAKIRIIESKWDIERYPNNIVYAQQTDLAKDHCSGDWLLYLQNDEVIHEDDHNLIHKACEQFLPDKNIDGMLFEYLHFWGDYNHYHQAHNWYPREIRIIRNDPSIHSWKDAQSFRRFSKFDHSYSDYQKKRDSSKLSVARIHARIFHYGWVRPPEIMTAKARTGNPTLAQKGFNGVRAPIPEIFDYGPLDQLTTFSGTHPGVMQKRLEQFDWSDKLQPGGKRNPKRPLYKHEKIKYRLLSWLEYGFLGGRQIGGFRNYKIVKKL